MPATPTRELSITYGSVTVSPDAQYHTVESSDAFSLEFDFLVSGTTEAAFVAACASARAAFRKPFQDLSVAQGGSALYAIKPSDNTGLETRSEIVKETHVANTGRSRRFHVRITCGLPADNVTTSGLREFSYTVAYSPSRLRLVTVSGVVTAVSSTGARDQYLALIDARVATLKTALGITTWELVSEDPTASSYNDKTMTFSRGYREIKFGQAGGADDSAIVEQQLHVSVRKWAERNAPGGSGAGSFLIPSPTGSGRDGMTSDVHPAGRPTGAGGAGTGGARAQPLLEISGRFECWIDFSAGVGIPVLAAKWASFRTWVIARMREVNDGGAFALTSEQPSYSPDTNRISVSLTAAAVPPGVSVIRREFSQTLTDDSGWRLVPAWTGNRLSKFAYQGDGRLVSTTRLVEETVGGGGAGTSAAAAGAIPGGLFRGGAGGGGLSISYPVDPAFNNIDMGFGSYGDSFIAGNPGGLGGLAAAAPQQYVGSGGPAGAVAAVNRPAQQGGGDPGSANPGGGLASKIITDTTTTEPTEYGLDTPIRIDRTTQLRILEYYSPVAQPVGYGART